MSTNRPLHRQAFNAALRLTEPADAYREVQGPLWGAQVAPGVRAPWGPGPWRSRTTTARPWLWGSRSRTENIDSGTNGVGKPPFGLKLCVVRAVHLRMPPACLDCPKTKKSAKKQGGWRFSGPGPALFPRGCDALRVGAIAQFTLVYDASDGDVRRVPNSIWATHAPCRDSYHQQDRTHKLYAQNAKDSYQ